MRAVDYFARHDKVWMRRLRTDNEIDAIARYLTNNPADAKCFSPVERDDAFDVGLGIHLVYETTGGSPAFTPGGAAYFTDAQAQYDANQALMRLHELDAPHGTVVYFAVDVNIPGPSCDAYMTVVDNTLRDAGFIAGVYGFEAMVEHARANYPLMGQHLWQTYGVVRGPLDLWQHEQLDIGGVQVDLNDAAVPGWTKEGSASVIETPLRTGQSADLQIRVGEVGWLQGLFGFPRAGQLQNRGIVRKVVASKPGRYIVEIRPPVDPDADETLVIDAEPAVFVVDVTA